MKAPDTARAEDWLEWISDHSAGGYADVTIPGVAVSHLCGAIEDPHCKGLIETWGTVILDCDDVAAIHDCVREMMREAGVRDLSHGPPPERDDPEAA